MSRTTDLRDLAGRFRAAEADERAHGRDALTPRGTRPIDAEGWPAGPITWRLEGYFGDKSTFEHLGGRAAFVVRPPARDWRTWLDLLAAYRYRLSLFGDGFMVSDTARLRFTPGRELPEVEAEGVTGAAWIEGVWRMSARLCELLADDSALTPDPAPPDRPSDQWRDLLADLRAFAAVPRRWDQAEYARMSLPARSGFPLRCLYGPAYDIDDHARPPGTEYIRVHHPTADMDDGTPEERHTFQALAGRAATLSGWAADGPENWRAWIALLYREAPEAWERTEVAPHPCGPDEGYPEAKAFDADGHPIGPWHAAHSLFSTTRAVALSIALGERQLAEALRLERLLADVVTPPAAPPSDAPAAPSAPMASKDDRPLTRAIGFELARLRDEIEEKQESFALLAGVKLKTLQTYEQGRQSVPPKKQLRIVLALNKGRAQRVPPLSRIAWPDIVAAAREHLAVLL